MYTFISLFIAWKKNLASLATLSMVLILCSLGISRAPSTISDILGKVSLFHMIFLYKMIKQRWFWHYDFTIKPALLLASQFFIKHRSTCFVSNFGWKFKIRPNVWGSTLNWDLSSYGKNVLSLSVSYILQSKQFNHEINSPDEREKQKVINFRRASFKG